MCMFPINMFAANPTFDRAGSSVPVKLMDVSAGMRIG